MIGKHRRVNEQLRSTSRLSLTTKEADRLVDLISPCFRESTEKPAPTRHPSVPLD
jgi:hypothetical protein